MSGGATAENRYRPRERGSKRARLAAAGGLTRAPSATCSSPALCRALLHLHRRCRCSQGCRRTAKVSGAATAENRYRPRERVSQGACLAVAGALTRAPAASCSSPALCRALLHLHRRCCCPQDCRKAANVLVTMTSHLKSATALGSGFRNKRASRLREHSLERLQRRVRLQHLAERCCTCIANQVTSNAAGGRQT